MSPGRELRELPLEEFLPSAASILCDYAMRLKPKRAGLCSQGFSLSQAFPRQLFLFRASSLLVLGVISGLRIFFCFSISTCRSCSRSSSSSRLVRRQSFWRAATARNAQRRRVVGAPLPSCAISTARDDPIVRQTCATPTRASCMTS